MQILSSPLVSASMSEKDFVNGSFPYIFPSRYFVVGYRGQREIGVEAVIVVDDLLWRAWSLLRTNNDVIRQGHLGRAGPLCFEWFLSLLLLKETQIWRGKKKKKNSTQNT